MIVRPRAIGGRDEAIGPRSRLWPASEYGPDLELEMLNPIANFLVDWVTIAELERADGRVPGEPHTDRIAEGLQAGLEAVVVNLAGIGEKRRADRLISRFRPWQGKEDFRVADDLAPAADGVALDVLRTQRRRLVSSHRPHAARVVRLEERQQLAVQSAAVADVAAQHKHRRKGQRGKPLDQVVRLVVLKVADRQTKLGKRALHV